MKNKISNIELGKIPPSDIDIEAHVLGYLFNLPEEYTEILFNILKPEYFYKNDHEILFNAMKKMHENNTLDTLNVINYLKTIGKIEQVGGPYYVSEVKKNNVKKINTAVSHCKIVFQKYIHRSIIKACQDGTERAYNEEDFTKNIEIVMNELNELYESSRDETIVDQNKAADDALSDIQNKIQGAVNPFYKTDIDGIDEIIKFSSENVCMIAGKSGSGKTKFITYLIYNLIKNNLDSVDVSWYALEDGRNKSQRSFMSILTLLSDDELQNKSDKKLNDDDMQRIIKAHGIIKDFPIEWHTNRRPIKQIQREFEVFVKQKPKENLKVLLIDNLNKLSDVARTQYDRENFIADTLGDMHDTYLNKNKVLIIVVHHFNDEQLEKTNIQSAFKPTEKMVKGSGSLRSISTQIMLTHNPGQFSELVGRYKHAEELLNRLFIVETVKNRGGNIGISRYFMSLEYNIFDCFDWKKYN